MEREWLAPFAVDVRRVLAVHRRGYGDPAYRTEPGGAIWWACRTPEGPGTLRVSWHAGPAGKAGPAGNARPAGKAGHGVQAVRPRADRTTAVRAQAWGPGASWLLDSLPGLLGAGDRPEDFVPAHPVLHEVARRHAALRIGRTGLVFEALVPAVLEQKVVGAEATRAWRILLTRFGEQAPGPAPPGLRVPPRPEAWAAIPSWEWHRAGVEAVRARTIASAARVASRLAEVTVMSSDDADRRLQALPGIGPWTSAEIRQRACGDADAVSVGDYHLPSIVGWALAGRAVDDTEMLQLLAPYRGHRHRASLLASLSGTHPGRRGPRLRGRDFRAL